MAIGLPSNIWTAEMRRREFIAGLGGAAAWPLASRAQQTTVPLIGFLHSGSPGPAAGFVTAFQQGLDGAGFVRGQNIAIEFQWAENRRDRLPQQAADLVHRQVAVIVAGGGLSTALAARAATATIPVVFIGGFDPIQVGLISSLNRPGGNITGFTNITAELETKRLELLLELVPAVNTVGLLVNPNSASSNPYIKDVQEAARALGKYVLVLKASADDDLDAAFATLVQQKTKALIVSAEPFFTDRRAQLIALAARHVVPTIFFSSEFAAAGGLISYGVVIADAYRQAGRYAARILKGEKPADLPVQQPTKFELVLNMKTAKALGLTIPETLLATADEVIQ
jgi:putative tryptophan/tyrosine transport system substrate-binding protein